MENTKYQGWGIFWLDQLFSLHIDKFVLFGVKKNDLPGSIRLFSYPQLRSEDKKFVTDDNGWFPVIRTSRLP